MKKPWKSPATIGGKMQSLVVTFTLLASLIVLSVLVIMSLYQKHYSVLLHNVTTASEFNQDFKTDIDLKMYYYVIDSQYSTGLPLDEVRDAQTLAQELQSTTTQKDSLLAINSVLDLCQNLEDKIHLIEQTQSYDERQLHLENNIYVLTSLIQEYMYNYLYFESVELNALQRQITTQILLELVLVMVLMGGLIVLMTRRSYRLSRAITVPVDQLCRRVEEVSAGSLEVRPPVESEDYEIQTLSQGLEQMVERINDLLQETTDKQESLRKAELALLQAQINPHFLYNTMDTIIWLIEAEKQQEAVEMVSNLSNFFRLTLSKGDDVITLAEEERHVRSYLQIQQVRYKDVLRYKVEIDPALATVELPKLTLQPLVENALYHGIKLKRAGGCITVTAKAEGDDVILRVSDDGVGLTAERLAHLRSAMARGERVGFGLSTVHERLRLFFGEGYGLSIDSREGEGTVITARVRKSKEV